MPVNPQTEHKIELKSAEIASIWTSYMCDSSTICLLENFLSNIEDLEIRSIVEKARQLSTAHIQKLTSFFNEEKIPVPDGFSIEADVNKDSSRLFTDDFYVFFIQNLCKKGLEVHSYALSTSARFDISEYYTECINETTSLYNESNKVMLSKGIFIRAPYVPTDKLVEYIQKKSYLTGWFGEKRPMNVVEITGIYYNMIRNQLGRTLSMGFSQAAKSKKVRDYFIRGRDIADKHVEVFGSILSDDDLPSASSWDILPTKSTDSTFSDKLMMFMMVSLSGLGVGNYGRSLGTTMRHDLALHYLRLISEVALYAEEGAKIMIENGWLEQLPQAPDRDQLANEKK